MTTASITGTKKPSAKSQNAMIADYLRKGNPITALVALQKFGCLRLAPRILELREAGMEIEADMVKVIGGARVAEYRIAKVSA